MATITPRDYKSYDFHNSKKKDTWSNHFIHIATRTPNLPKPTEMRSSFPDITTGMPTLPKSIEVFAPFHPKRKLRPLTHNHFNDDVHTTDRAMVPQVILSLINSIASSMNDSLLPHSDAAPFETTNIFGPMTLSRFQYSNLGPFQNSGFFFQTRAIYYFISAVLFTCVSVIILVQLNNQ